MQRDLTRWAQAVTFASCLHLHPQRGLSPGGLEPMSLTTPYPADLLQGGAEGGLV